MAESEPVADDPSEPSSAGRLRRNKAVLLSLLDDGTESNATFVVAKKALPRDKANGDLHLCNISVPKYVEPGPEIESAQEEAEETNRIFKTVASIPIEDIDMVYCHLLQLNKCYQAMAPNNKMIVFMDNMNVRKAFYALIYNSTRTGLVLDSQTGHITGVLSATDFIMVLMKLWRFRSAITYLKGTDLTEDEVDRTDITTMPISKWKEHLRADGRLKPFQTISVDDSLYAAAGRLTGSRIHRLPVMDEKTGDCMFIITHRRLLHFIWQHAALLPKPSFMRSGVRELGIGTWKDVKYVLEETPLIDALDTLINGGISGVPVVKDRDSLEIVSVYTRFDAIAVAFSDSMDDFALTVREAIKHRRSLTGRIDTVVTISEDIDLWSLLEMFVKKNVHRIFAVDEKKRLKGLVSLSDVINFLVLRHHKTSSD